MTTCNLRAHEAADAEALYAAVRESAAELSTWMPWCHPDYALSEAREWTSSRQALAEQGLEYSFAIVDTAGTFLGGCGINQINRVHRFGNLGYWVRTTATGRGVATSAVVSLADWAFGNTDLVRLEIVCAVENERSQRVAARAGATREGVLRERLSIHGRSHDAVMYGITRGVWRVGEQSSVRTVRVRPGTG
ncbi:MAG TPA: GNAT family protein [Vicinamibacteria bacterium]|nr:GNAT family protein [Vicinamibacteria bacterium]